jgi:hypothetical protein
MKLIQPWCQYIDLSQIQNNKSIADLFYFLMDMIFMTPEFSESAFECWLEIFKSSSYGETNLAIMTETIVQVCGKIEKCRGICLEMIIRLSEFNCHDVGAILISHLSADSFPWKTETQTPLQIILKTTVKSYVSNLCVNLGASDEGLNEYAVYCRSASLLISELLIQRFSEFSAYIPIILNFSLMYLPNSLQEESVSTLLLKNMIEGLIGILHSMRNLQNDTYNLSQAKVRKFLSWNELKRCKIDWNIKPL